MFRIMKAKKPILNRAYFAAQGKKGGIKTSKAKAAAVRANLEKARAKRWPKKRAA